MPAPASTAVEPSTAEPSTGTGQQVSLAAEPPAEPVTPNILRASSEPLFQAEVTPPPLAPPKSPPSKNDEPLESDASDAEKKLEIVNVLAQYLAACPSHLEMPVKKGHGSDSGDGTPVSCVPLADNKAWGFESISLHVLKKMFI